MSEERSMVNVLVNVCRFSTSRNTLLWDKSSFFSVLLSGRIPSCKDEEGAYFIDRDPTVFAFILNYLRTGELNLVGIDPVTLKNEAQFYGLDSLGF
ncbi:K channel tetramerization domain-containing protein [Paragonimus heterotremus]|uniref:K channel tetramerization domain-containing protein n=1 Tax=Paragonimus heterotremus TaxID=100268 RepID=A0A8J4SYF0_9TREM|nr:K channel tetramerization domain-containing protein [Paragonimus heterotremus]